MQRKHLLVFGVLVSAIGFLLLPSAGLAGSAPSIAWSPPSYGYGPVHPSQTASQSFTLANSKTAGSSTGALTISITGTGRAAYSITSNSCNGVALGKGKSCAVTVQFAPTTAGQDYPASLVATGKKPAGGAATAALSGSGTPAVQPPVLSVTQGNDANQDGAYSGQETLPTTTTYPHTVSFFVSITNSSSSPAVITSISDDKVPPPLVSASTTDTDCADLIGILIGSDATITCNYDETLADGTTPNIINTVTVTATNNAGSDSRAVASTVRVWPVVSVTIKAGTMSLVSIHDLTADILYPSPDLSSFIRPQIQVGHSVVVAMSSGQAGVTEGLPFNYMCPPGTDESGTFAASPLTIGGITEYDGGCTTSVLSSDEFITADFSG
jgi:hypothetical protein